MLRTMPGAGTMNSPISVDSDDESEDEVINELTHLSCDTTPMESPTEPPSTGEPNWPIPGSSCQVEQSLGTDKENGSHFPQPARGTKRPRSASMNSRGSSTSNEGPARREGTQPPMNGAFNGPPPESRKAKKRRRNAEKKKEQYLQRLARLTNAPNLAPQYPLGVSPLFAQASTPFTYLHDFNPQLQQLLNADFSTQNNIQEVQRHAHPAWSMPPNTMSHYQDPAQPWTFQHPPPAGPLMSSAMTPPPMPANLGAQSVPAKPPKRIGLPLDEDPNSKRGLFKIPDSALDKDKKPYIPTPAFTLVLEKLPKTHRTPEFVRRWARCASGAFPTKVIIDGPSSKALVEFASSQDARNAWESPQLGTALKGLRPHQLKDKPREDLIQAYWYRVDGISDGVGELEEGEIEVSGQKGPEEKLSKKQKRKLDRERREKEDRARRDAAPGPSRIVPSSQSGIPSQTMAGFTYNGLPPRPDTFPPLPSHSHLPLPPLATNGLPLAITPDGDDMEFSPYSPEGPSPFPGSASNWNPQARPFVPSRIPSAPRAMTSITQTEPTYLERTLEQNGKEANPRGVAQPSVLSAPIPSTSTEKMEADLRARVRKSRVPIKPDSPANPSVTLRAPPPTEPVSSPEMDDAADFIAKALGVPAAVPPSKPPPPPRTNSAALMKADLAEKHQRLEQEIAERKMLMDQLESATTKAEKDVILARLRGKDRASKELDVKPSAKINLDYVPAPQLQRPSWPSHQHRTVLMISDDEEADEDDDA